jgi:hypothetical protein
MISELGGEVTKDEHYTHLLSTPQAFRGGKKKNDKIKEAQDMGCPIINSLKWISEEKLDPRQMSSCYLWEPLSPANDKPNKILVPKPAVQRLNQSALGSYPLTSTAKAAANDERDKRKVRFQDDARPSQALSESTISEAMGKLIAFIWNLDESSLKRLSETNINQGLKYLEETQKHLQMADMKFSMYHTVIPHTGHIIDYRETVKKEEIWLRQVLVIKEMVEIATIDDASDEFKYLEEYLKASSGAGHDFTYEVKDIFRVERHGERERFQAHIEPQETPIRRLLWYGSPRREYGRILTKGLEIAPVEVPGLSQNFGDGIHLFETSLQAAEYCDHREHSGEALLLLCEAALGYPYNKVTEASDSNANDTKMRTTRCEGKTAFKRFINGGEIHESLEGIKVVSRTLSSTIVSIIILTLT